MDFNRKPIYLLRISLRMNMAVDILLPLMLLEFPRCQSFRLIDKDTHQVYFGTFAVVRKYSHLIPRRS